MPAPTRPNLDSPLSVSDAHSSAGVVVREGPGGPRSHVVGGMDVWEYVLVAQGYDGDAKLTAVHLNEPVDRVRLALAYYQKHTEEIQQLLDEQERIVAAVPRLRPSRNTA